MSQHFPLRMKVITNPTTLGFSVELGWACPKKTQQPICRAIYARKIVKILHKKFLITVRKLKGAVWHTPASSERPAVALRASLFSFHPLDLLRRIFYFYMVTNNRQRRPAVKIECRQRRGFSAPFLMLSLLLLRLLPLPSFPELSCSFDSLILTGPQLTFLLRLAP